MMPIIATLIGAALGFWVGHDFDALVGGGFIGLIVGLVIHQYRQRSAPDIGDPAAARFAAIEARLARLESALERSGVAPLQSAAPPPAETAASSVTVATVPVTSRAVPPEPAYGSGAKTESRRLWRWITGGNPLARVGIIVLFVGVGFLLRYAAEHATVPIALRLAGVALGGIALLVVGWRLRERRGGYAMILQGGGVGVLYLTVFAALALYALVPRGAAFALLFLIAALSSWLAVRQDSVALAALGVVGGFLAPILTSSEAGNHVVLFSYYALLNAGILFIAWFKAWRLLNLLGFAFTFVIGTLWGVTRYRAADFATTEPFLILFVLFYVGIAVLYALKRSVQIEHSVDGTIVFGTPLVAAGLQQALVRDFEFGMAVSAAALSLLYFISARLLWTRGRDDLRLLAESFLALGVAFATLAVPLAVDAHWTSATWALEGAAIVWIGARQDRFAARVFGLALQIAAGVAFASGSIDFIGPIPAQIHPLLNNEFVGAALVACAGLASAWTLDRNAAALRPWERAIAPLVFVWGGLWWLGAGGHEIDRFVRHEAKLAFIIVFLALTGLAFALAARQLSWRHAGTAARLLLPLLLLCALFGIAQPDSVGGHLFANVGGVAWAFALLTSLLLLRMFDADAVPTSPTWLETFDHAAFVSLICLVVAEESAWFVRLQVDARTVWYALPWGIVPALALASISALMSRASWPFTLHRDAYRFVAAFVLIAWMMVFSLIVNLGSDGNPAPLPYLPLANPLDLTLALIAAAMALWRVRLAREGLAIDTRVPREILYGAPAALAFIWANAIILRTIHHGFAVPWRFDALWHSTLAQAALSLLWTIIALAVMVLANRRGARSGWIAGATLLGVVVAKLFVVDLSRVAGIERIVSFIGVGLLLLLIGYLAPVPPSRKDGTAASDVR